MRVGADVDAQGVGEAQGDFPVGQAGQRGDDAADTVDAALGVGEGAVLFQECGAWEEDVGVVGCLVQEEVLDDDALHGAEAGDDVA